MKKIELTEAEKKLLKIVEELQDKNKWIDVVISGSLAIKIHGVDIEREVGDLDLLISEYCDELEIPDDYEFIDSDKDYGIGYMAYMKDGIQVDIFSTDESHVEIDGIKVATIDAILEAKGNIVKESKDLEAVKKHLRDLLNVMRWERSSRLEKLYAKEIETTKN